VLSDKCAAITGSGSKCKASAMEGSTWCYNHDPTRQAERKANASKGGKRGGRGRPLTELAALRGELSDLREKLLEGELEPRVVGVATQSINVDARLIDLTLKAKEQMELEQRLEEIEQALAVRKRGYTYDGA
jgi:hypothetical protein